MGGFAKDLKDLKSKIWYPKYMGFDAILISPIFKSPSYHKYDTTDYYQIDPQFGTREDFIELVNELEKNNMGLVMDFVLCHTSVDHPWFKDCAEGKNDFYTLYKNQSDIPDALPTPMSNYSWDYSDKYKTWYLTPWHNEMASLNFNSPQLMEELGKILQHWLSISNNIHVRLDAILYCDLINNKPHEHCAEIRKICESINPNIQIIGEVWDNNNIVQSFADVLGSCFSFDDCNKIKQAVWNRQSYEQIGSPDLTYFAGNHDMTRLYNCMGCDVEKVKDVFKTLYSTKARHITVYYGDEICQQGNAYYDQRGHGEVRRPLDWGDIDRRIKEPQSLINFVKGLNENRK